MDEIQPVVIPLKAKYRSAKKTRNPINGDHQRMKPKHHKIGKTAHDKIYGAPRDKIMLLKKSGGSVMVYTDELRERLS